MLRFRFFAATVATAAAFAVTPASAQNVDGQTLFKQRCAACHSIAAGKPSTVGPNLHGVVGRKAATAKFSYSTAMKNSKMVWTKPVLDKYLAAPTKVVPGTKMVISITNTAQRAAIIEYLSTQR